MTEILRVFLCGAHSTGKTTLLEDLMPLLNMHAYSNVARELMQKSGLDRDKVNHQKYPEQFYKLQENILKQLLDNDDESLSRDQDYICDRGIDPLIYAYAYLGEEPGKRLLNLPSAQKFVCRLRKSLLFVLLPHDECLVDDGFRLRPDMKELQTFTERMISLLEELEIPYKVIESLDRKARQKFVLEEVLKAKAGLVKT